MGRIQTLIIVFLSVILSTGFVSQKIDYRQGRFMNVCKGLNGDALIYCIFVDTKETKPWLDFDIRTTIDSLRIAVQWLNKQAQKNKITLNIKSDYFIGDEFATIRKNLPMGDVYKSVTEPNMKTGIFELNNWANSVAKRAGMSLNIIQKDGIPDITNPRDKERFVAYLRDEYNVESVALMFMVNNYYKTDISISLNTLNTEDVEFAIVSYKYPAEIAHNFLHLYGAADMYETPYRKNDKKIEVLQKLFPNEIMLDPYAKNIWDLEISEYTKYLIGWSNSIAPLYEDLLVDKSLSF
ncbi:MAG: hypothetical protein JXB49_27310 [Bacteroidales bacterium]|nr:hypothetical protein [Bacteroidales bacterium]